jgi:hypothetical protein
MSIAAPLTGESLEAARRAQELSDKAYHGESPGAVTDAELKDWAIYCAYWEEVYGEMRETKSLIGVVLAFEVSEEVRKRLQAVKANG